ncbi:MAG: hypothetical protein L6435_13940, partial [Anaerolineae bacterium]|nr:hypothetical protein [Anaerolineae bacterium]
LKQKASRLSAEEEQELDRYEEVDDYLSFLNRIVRNLLYAQSWQDLQRLDHLDYKRDRLLQLIEAVP